MNVGAILIAATVTLTVQPTPSRTGGTITYTGTNLTCKQVEAFMEKMAEKSHGKIKPLPCRETAPVWPKKSN
jgi:hypothetical protein